MLSYMASIMTMRRFRAAELKKQERGA